MPAAYAREIRRDQEPRHRPGMSEHEQPETLHPERRYVAQQLRGLAHSLEVSHVRSEAITPTERNSALSILSEVMGHVSQGQG